MFCVKLHLFIINKKYFATTSHMCNKALLTYLLTTDLVCLLSTDFHSHLQKHDKANELSQSYPLSQHLCEILFSSINIHEDHLQRGKILTKHNVSTLEVTTFCICSKMKMASVSVTPNISIKYR